MSAVSYSRSVCVCSWFDRGNGQRCHSANRSVYVHISSTLNETTSVQWSSRSTSSPRRSA